MVVHLHIRYCSIWVIKALHFAALTSRQVLIWSAVIPVSSRWACHSTAPSAEVDSKQIVPAARPLLPSHWWSYPSTAREHHAAYQTTQHNTDMNGQLWQHKSIGNSVSFNLVAVLTLASILGSTATTSDRHFMALVLTAMALSPNTLRI